MRGWKINKQLLRLWGGWLRLKYSKCWDNGADLGGDTWWGGGLQALPVGAVDVPQRCPVPRVDTDQDRQRGTGQLLGTEIRPHAGADPQSNARGHRCQFAESRRNGTNSQTLQVIFCYLLSFPALKLKEKSKMVSLAVCEPFWIFLTFFQYLVTSFFETIGIQSFCFSLYFFFRCLLIWLCGSIRTRVPRRHVTY